MRAPTEVSFDCVAAADAAGGIGKDNDLPWPRLPGDLAFLRGVTTNAPPGQRNAVIMGRLTWESVPSQKQPLPGRLNVVISRQPLRLPPGVQLAGSLDEALAVPGVTGRFVIGGAQLFRHAFAHPGCRFLYLTRLQATFPCDAFLPPLDGFVCEEVLERHREQGIAYEVARWRRQLSARAAPEPARP